MQRKVIFVHGMGVRKDARGVFTDIVKSFSEDENFKDIKCILTDLNIIKENGDSVLNPLDVQAEIIQKIYDAEKTDSEITFICHSQGCVVVSLMELENLNKIFLLTPPTNNDLQRSINRMKKRPGSFIDIDGESVAVRSDGTKTTIPKEYWQNRKELVYLDAFEKLSSAQGKDKIKIIIAKQDDVLSNEALPVLEEMGEVFQIDGDHNFTDNRVELAQVIKEIF